MINRLARLCLLVGGLLIFTIAVGAQAAGYGFLSKPITDNFPINTVFLHVYDADGNFLHNLNPAELTVLEDSQQADILEINKQNPGIQFVVAINPGHAFAIRDGQGLSRYDYLAESLLNWANGASGSKHDDISLIIKDGPVATHLMDYKEWIRVLGSYQEDARGEVPNLEALTRAVEVASDPAPDPAMGRAVLFITPPVEGELSVGLQSLSARARQQSIRVFVWFISSPDYLNYQGATHMQSLAEESGGQFFAYSGVEPIPDVESYLEPLRYVYRLEYASRISTSGSHELQVEVEADNALIATASQTFDLEVHPPNPMFVGPPLNIVRSLPADSNSDQPELAPKEQTLEVLVEFPDGFSRHLQSSVLYIDGTAYAINDSPPFDQFTWDLSGYLEDSNHLIRVEVVDSLGLAGSSVELPVRITVERQSANVFVTLASKGPLVAGMAALLSGAVLALVLILGGRIRPRVFGQESKASPLGKNRKGWLPGRRRNDPVTQPVTISESKAKAQSRHIPHWMDRLHKQPRSPAPEALAFLSRLEDGEGAASSTPIPIDEGEITIGRDPAQCTIALEDLSLESVHARLRRENDTYRLMDEGSIAGTWVNYTPISKGGAVLEHGDLVHIGRVGFRFSLRDPARVRKPVILPEEPSP